MVETLRHLLLQQGARLQERPALAAPGWEPLSYLAFRNRVEGLALGLMAEARPPGTAVFAATGSAWDWAVEVAAAACGLVWDPAGRRLEPGDLRPGDEGGRQAYHDREDAVLPGTPFAEGLDHAAWLLRLRRLNTRLGWDHATRLDLPLAALPTPEGRLALWSAFFAGAAVVLVEAAPKGLRGRFRREVPWDPSPFME